jgi:pilus assembly protein Flp/PilA
MNSEVSVQKLEIATWVNLNWRPKMKMIKKLFKNEDGATAIEYGLIAALIAVAAITAMGGLGNSLSNTFNKVNNNLKTS